MDFSFYDNGLETDYNRSTFTSEQNIFLQTEEGRVFPYSTDTSNYYQYFLTDYLGNTRIAFDTPNDTLKVEQQDDYMPFGMEISQGAVANPKNEYLYNKKELQEGSQLYDYGARFYDPVVGRWTTVDPHAFNYKQVTPYNYVQNNPIGSYDPNGKDIIVLSAPHEAGGAGHAAILIGNPQKGYDFYSKNGTTYSKGASGVSDLNPVIGHHYDSLEDFLKSDDNKWDGKNEYALGYDIKTNDDQDMDMEQAAMQSIFDAYNVLFRNCMDVASDALKAGKLDPGYSPQNFIPNHFLTPLPNVRFKFIIRNNPGGILINLSESVPTKEKKGIVTAGSLSSPVFLK